MPRRRAKRDIEVEPVEIVFHSDVLCPWCYIAERRLQHLAEEFAGVVTIRHSPFALYLDDRLPTAAERRRYAAQVRKAAKEPDAKDFSPALWLAPDPPTSSYPPLAALAAARAQGPAAETRLRLALRKAAFVRGLNISRRDVILEVADAAGLDPAKLAVGLSSTAVERSVAEEHEAAMEENIDAIPAIVIGDEWLVTGCRDLDEYREILQKYLAARAGPSAARLLH